MESKRLQLEMEKNKNLLDDLRKNQNISKFNSSSDPKNIIQQILKEYRKINKDQLNQGQKIN